MKKKSTDSEDYISNINSNIFFREFTFKKNTFKQNQSSEFELADNIVWLDDILLIFQIKEKENGDGDLKKWFRNKVLNKAVKQIKDTHKYLATHEEIIIENEKGLKKNILESKHIIPNNIIIYSSHQEFAEEDRFQKFYRSSEVGLIHLFHTEDYYWICRYLITPAEVKEYLDFRERLYKKFETHLNSLPEQYVMGHFLNTLETDHLEARYIESLKTIKPDEASFDISYLIENFDKNITHTNPMDYYPIIAEIAKLNRRELGEFKKRFIKAIEQCKEEDFVPPYRIYVPATDCAFIFIRLPEKLKNQWQIPLHKCSLVHKYESQAKKCVGVVVYSADNQIGMQWLMADFEWSYDANMESLVEDTNSPLRKLKTQAFGNRYCI